MGRVVAILIGLAVMLWASPPAHAQGVDRSELTIIQFLLQEKGYDPGPADGLMGGRTRAAIRAFQTDAGLPATGEPSSGLIERLRGAPVTQRATRPKAATALRPSAVDRAAAEEFFKQGFTLYQEGAFSEAARQFEKGFRLDPENAVAHYYAGKSYEGLRDYPKAIASYEAAIASRANIKEVSLARVQLLELNEYLDRFIKRISGRAHCIEAAINLKEMDTGIDFLFLISARMHFEGRILQKIDYNMKWSGVHCVNNIDCYTGVSRRGHKLFSDTDLLRIKKFESAFRDFRLSCTADGLNDVEQRIDGKYSDGDPTIWLSAPADFEDSCSIFGNDSNGRPVKYAAIRMEKSGGELVSRQTNPPFPKIDMSSFVTARLDREEIQLGPLPHHTLQSGSGWFARCE